MAKLYVYKNEKGESVIFGSKKVQGSLDVFFEDLTEKEVKKVTKKLLKYLKKYFEVSEKMPPDKKGFKKRYMYKAHPDLFFDAIADIAW